MNQHSTDLQNNAESDPLVREGGELLCDLLLCTIYNQPDRPQDDKKEKFKREVTQRFIPSFKATQEAHQDFMKSEWVREVSKSPIAWVQVRDFVRRDAIQILTICFLLTLATVTAGYFCHQSKVVWDPGLYIWAMMSINPLIFGARFLPNLRVVRQWDRMWESSAAARALCPNHPAFNPPQRARKVIAFFHSPETCYDVLEMLDDNFEKHSAEFGFRYARNWYAWNALKSLSSMLDAGIERAVKWSFIGGMIEWARHLLMNRN